MADWYRMQPDEVAIALKTDFGNGLSQAEASQRLTELGRNELTERGSKGVLSILLEQFTGLMVLILVAAAVISGALGDFEDLAAIVAIIILNAVLGFTQEYRAEKAMAALKSLAVPTVRVRRDGHLHELPAGDLVPGDVVQLEAGGFVPADGRLIESANLRVQESVLTGESEAVEKHPDTLDAPDLPLGDRVNSVYMGTTVTYGRGVAVVTDTGMQTQLGGIANLIQSVDQESTPLQRRLDQLGKGLAAAAGVIVLIVFALGLIRGEDLRLMSLTAISMAVAAVPEGLPAVVTVALALGAQRMLRRRALIRKLPAVETLGSVTTICSDKTGTLTENRMTVTVLDVAGHRIDLNETLERSRPVVLPADDPVGTPLKEGIALLALGGALANDAVLERTSGGLDHFRAVGDPTEGALVVAAARLGIWKSDLESILRRVAEVPFDSERKRMTTLHVLEDLDRVPEVLSDLRERAGPDRYVAFSKGAVDSLLEICSGVWAADHFEPMTEEWRQRIMDANNGLAQNGMRVLGIAYKLCDGTSSDAGDLERDLNFVGLAGMMDPPRPEVKEAVRRCRAAGIRPVMITGDHPLTAVHIARELGIAGESRVITGQDLAAMTVEELEEQVEEVSVYARVSPEHKLKIVQALQDRGEIVAMTGDGVNDAPALKKADIGVAMGITGTDVSKEAADMVLLDDNFATIVAAVEEGRIMYDNIRKFIKYALTSNTAEVLVMLAGPLLGMPLPLTPLQILWVNLVTDGLPGLALGFEPGEPDTMRRPPIRSRESIFARGIGAYMVGIGVFMAIVALGVGYWAFSTGREDWRPIIFTTLTLSQMGNVLAVRSERESLFTTGLLSNKPLLGAVALTLVLQMCVIYLPFLQGIFETVPLPAADLAICLVLSSAVFWLVELLKWFARRSGAATSRA